jgi:hypothetical protein
VLIEEANKAQGLGGNDMEKNYIREFSDDGVVADRAMFKRKKDDS